MAASAGQATAAHPAVSGFPDPHAVALAHQKLVQDSSIQFDLPAKEIVHHPPPQWLIDLFHALSRFSAWVGSGWTWILIGIGVLLLAVVIVAVTPGLRNWIAGRFRRKTEPTEASDWTPEAATVRRLLEEADRLAAQGRFDEAVHLILFRSIEDIEQWRGNAVRPSFTSRDIARIDALPEAARGVFSRIVAMVERSFFGGRALDSGDWHHARDDYARFALKAA